MRKLKMKKRILSAVMTVCMMCSVFVGTKPVLVQAAASVKYEHLTISSGFNADVVATSSTSSSLENYRNTDALDGSGTASSKACFYSSEFSSSSGYLPSDRIIKDSSNSALTWKLGSYTSDNALKLGAGKNGTLIFDKTGCYQDIYLLSVCGGVEGGSTSMKAVVNYTDGTSGTGYFTVVDWYTSTSSATAAYRRVDGGTINGSTSAGPFMTKSTISGLDTSRVVKSVTIYNTGTSSNIFLSVFAATGKTANVGIPTPDVDSNSITTNQFTINWAATTNAATYRVDVATDSTFTTMIDGYNNKVVNDTSCVVAGLDRNTTYYYRVRAANSSGAQSGSSTYNAVTTHKADVIYNDNGGVGGPNRTDLNASWQLPASVVVPTRKGYVFNGYYTSLINGIKYFDAAGNRVYDTAFETNCASRMTVYAQWIINASTLTIDANGGVLEGETSYTRKYNESVAIKDPIYEGEEKTFLGWTILDANGNASDNGKLVKGAGYTTFLFGPESSNVTLKAIWSAPNGATIVVEDSVEQEITGENLDRVYRHEVEDTDKGLTAEDLVAETRELVLTVDQITVDKEESAALPESVATIENLLEDSSFEALNYYDITVKKIINGTTTNLIELPETVKITIPLTGTLENRSGYSVYRVHDGKAERMSSSRSSTEYYEVNGNTITIYTKKFSTYAITASSSVIGEYQEEELDDTNNTAATDVQGKYVDSTSTRVYKVDVEWGAMKFVFNKHQKWNPDTHSYNDEIKILLDESAYVDGNNEIVISNHSNADFRVGMSVVEKDMDGVEIYLKQENSNSSEDAVDMYLNKVADASGMAAAEQVSAYVRLDEGMLNAAGLSELTADGKTNVFQQIARVVITIEAVQDSKTTPMYFGN